jgi:hypothetical protein
MQKIFRRAAAPSNNAMHLTVNSRLRRLLQAGDRQR